MITIDNKAKIEDVDKKHALIDCEYFVRCYNDANESYLCPLTKENALHGNLRRP